MTYDVNSSLRQMMKELLKKEMKDVTVAEIDKLNKLIGMTEQSINRNVFISPNTISRIHKGLMKQAKDFIIEFHEFTLKKIAPVKEKKEKVIKKETKKKVTKSKTKVEEK